MSQAWKPWGAAIGLFALLLCGFVVFNYWRFPNRRKQPATMLLFKTICDFLFAFFATIMIISKLEPKHNSNVKYFEKQQ